MWISPDTLDSSCNAPAWTHRLPPPCPNSYFLYSMLALVSCPRTWFLSCFPIIHQEDSGDLANLGEFHTVPGLLSKCQATLSGLSSNRSSYPVYRLNVVFSKYLQVEILNPNVIELGGEAFERQNNYVSGALINGVNARMQRPKGTFSLSAVREGYNQKTGLCKPKRRTSSDSRSASKLTLDFRGSRNVRNTFLSLKPPSPWNCVAAAWAD